MTENESYNMSNYTKLINKHTAMFDVIIREFRTENGNEMNPSLYLVGEALEFSKNIGKLIPDITPLRYEIMGRIEAAQLALEDEDLEKIYYHVKEALEMWISIADSLKEFNQTITYINTHEKLSFWNKLED